MIPDLELLSIATAGPASAGDIVAIVYKDFLRECALCRTTAPAVADLLGASSGWRGWLPSGPGLVRFRERHASAAS